MPIWEKSLSFVSFSAMNRVKSLISRNGDVIDRKGKEGTYKLSDYLSYMRAAVIYFPHT